MTDDADPAFSAEELIDDGDEPLRLLSNAQTVLWDIDRELLTDREKSRLSTIERKIDELHDLRRERLIGDLEGIVDHD